MTWQVHAKEAESLLCLRATAGLYCARSGPNSWAGELLRDARVARPAMQGHSSRTNLTPKADLVGVARREELANGGECLLSRALAQRQRAHPTLEPLLALAVPVAAGGREKYEQVRQVLAWWGGLRCPTCRDGRVTLRQGSACTKLIAQIEQAGRIRRDMTLANRRPAHPTSEVGQQMMTRLAMGSPPNKECPLLLTSVHSRLRVLRKCAGRTGASVTGAGLEARWARRAGTQWRANPRRIFHQEPNYCDRRSLVMHPTLMHSAPPDAL